MFRVLFYIGLALLVPGLVAMGVSLCGGPVEWFTDTQTFWGLPISLFVFWIGLAHAGTLISAAFLVLNVKMDRRTALLAEMSTLCSLFVAVCMPLMHLGVIENFYMAAPLMDARGNISNVRSPLVWDFCCIAVYGVISLLFFVSHFCMEPQKGDSAKVVVARAWIKKVRRPMAWILFPLVLWVHSVVSLDFASAFVPQWQGAFFPLYFIAGAVFSGLALVNLLLMVENYRVRILEKLLLVCSWFMCAFWLWNYILNGDFCVSAFVLAGLLPQLVFVEWVRETRWAYSLLCVSVLLGMLLERVYLVSPSFDSFGWVDLGIVSFGVGFFLVAFYGLRRLLQKGIENDEILMGDVENYGEALDSEFEAASRKYFPPLSTPEYRILRLPVLFGILIAILFSIWVFKASDFANVELLVVNVMPLFGPVVALVAALMLTAEALWIVSRSAVRWGVVFVLVAAAGACGAFYAGGSSVPEKPSAETASQLLDNVSVVNVVWDSRCATCHGTDGKFNEKFVREFYPVPQELSLERLDSIGEDSLVQVILQGRVNMNSYDGRISEEMARNLVMYMRILAERDSAKLAAADSAGIVPTDSISTTVTEGAK